MSIGNIKSKSIDYKELPGPFPVSTVTPYTRPAGWLTLPTLLTTDYKFVGLYAIFENANYVALQAVNIGGSFYVDWGDGTNGTYATGTTASHEYDYSTYDTSNTTLITRNNLTYKQVIITITPVTVNNIGALNFCVAHPSDPRGTYGYNWLDISVNMPTITSLTFTNANPTFYKLWLLEQITIGIVNGSAGANMFNGCRKLQNVIMNTSVQYNNCIYMFAECTELQTIPYFNTSTCTDFTSMFQNCYALLSIPSEFNTSSATNTTSMFSNCYSLVSIPSIKTGSNATSLFSGCKALKNIILNSTILNNATSMFQGCSSLEESPIISGNLSGTSYMFNSCTKLKKVNYFNTQSVTSMANMFQSCTSLESVPYFNTGSVGNFGYMFTNCTSLKSVPNFNTSTGVLFTSMFQGCSVLAVAPTFTSTANVTDMSSMFLSCNALTDVPLYDTSKVTNMASMFQNCYALQSVPSFNTIKVTSMYSMFQNCYALQSVPSFNTVACTNMTNMVYNCYSLSAIPTFNTTVCTIFTAMFQGSGMITIPALVTTSGSATGFANLTALCTNLQKFDMIIRGATSFAATRLNKTQLESIFANAVRPSTTQVMTITGALGADAGVNLSCTGAVSATTLTTASTTGLTTDMYISGTNSGVTTGRAVTFTTGTNIVTTTTAHGFSNNDLIFFSTVTTTTSIVTFTPYYIINATSTDFQVSLTSGGSAVTVNASGTGTVKWAAKVVSFVANTSITLDRPISTTAMSATSVNFRLLNIFPVLAKNYTITG